MPRLSDFFAADWQDDGHTHIRVRYGEKQEFFLKPEEIDLMYRIVHRPVGSEIVDERDRQDVQWGIHNHDPLYWLAILGEEYGEACRAIVQHNNAMDLREELIQVAAVATAFIESLDRNELRNVNRGN